MIYFIIGLHKTGTSSVDHALSMFDIPCVQGFDTFKQDISHESNKAGIIERVEDGKAYRGFPYSNYPEFLRDQYPDAKFIWTIRDPDPWYASVAKNWGKSYIPQHNFYYETEKPAVDAETEYLAGYIRHTNDMVQAFKHCPDRVLLMDVTAGDGWEKLCPFIGVDIPDEPFPHKNITPR